MASVPRIERLVFAMEAINASKATSLSGRVASRFDHLSPLLSESDDRLHLISLLRIDLTAIMGVLPVDAQLTNRAPELLREAASEAGEVPICHEVAPIRG